MNKKTEKILVGIGIGLLGAFGIYKFVKSYKKGMEELKNQEFQETEDLVNIGVDTDKLKKEIKTDETDFTKMLYTAVRFNSDIDLDLLDIDNVYDNLDEKTIHVRQRIDTHSKHNESRRRLDFIIDIPDYTENSYRGPKIGNFLTTFKETAMVLSEDIVKFSHPATKKLIGSVIISRMKDGKSIVEYRELVPNVYKQYADEEHDGLTKFYEVEKKRFNVTGVYDYIKDAGWLYVNCPDLDPNDETVLIEGILLQYIISFPIRSNRPDELYGIDTKTGVECIKYLTEKLYVGREDSRNKIEYRSLMFNAPNSDGIPDLSWYYTTDSEDRVVIENVCGFYDDEN